MMLTFATRLLCHRARHIGGPVAVLRCLVEEQRRIAGVRGGKKSRCAPALSCVGEGEQASAAVGSSGGSSFHTAAAPMQAVAAAVQATHQQHSPTHMSCSKETAAASFPHLKKHLQPVPGAA